MSLITHELVKRLTGHFGEESDIKISFKEDLPLQDYFKLIDTHFDVSSKSHLIYISFVLG